MIHRPRKIISSLGGALALAAVILCHQSRAEDVILHLRNGDRIAGSIVLENTNQITISNIWTKDLAIPLSQVERRESAITNATTIATITNTPASTNIAAVKTNLPTGGTNTPLAGQNASPLVTAPAPPPPKLPWYKHWKGEINVGSDMAHGATDRELYYGKATVTYSLPYDRNPKEFFRNIFTYSADYGQTDGVLSADDMNGSSKTDFDLTPRIYLYNLGGAGFDEIQKIHLHYEDGPGAGYHLFKGSNFVANVELGANYQVQDRSDNTRTESFYYRFGEDVMWKIAKSMTLTEKFEFFPRAENVKQYRSRLESTLSYALMLNLSMNLSVIDQYDTQPAAGVPKNDFQFRTSLGIKF